MTDFSQMLRWNTNFVRGLAQSVLDRAKLIRSGLTAAAPASKSIKIKNAKSGKATGKKKTATKTAAPKGRRRRG